MRHDAAQFALGQHAHDTGGGRHRGVVGIAPGGKGVGLGLVDDVHLGHRQVGTLRQLAHHVVQIGRGTGIDLAGVVHLEHRLVGEPVGPQVHAAPQQQGNQHALLAADGTADDAEQGDDAGHQNGRLQPVSKHCRVPL
ncbi:hypothetical protein SDC9_188273 [bioreactor metagenome]|uniref:Uncharacterized protein n=1 Tax=bioreactor metagenome TaxID=1076179 RepID=A0A645HX17_9ZZZZ